MKISVLGYSVKVSIFVCTIFAAAEAVAQSEPNRLTLSAKTASATMVPLETETWFSCAYPERPAFIDLSFVLEPSRYNFEPFRKAEPKANPVVVRRGGNTGQDQEERSGRKKVSTARFTQSWLDRSKREEMTDLAFVGSFFFCDYNGFPQFMGAEYTISGRFGVFLIQRHQAAEARPGWNVRYSSRKQISPDGKQILSPEFSISPGRLGFDSDLLTFRFKDDAVPLVIEGSGQKLLVNLTVRAWVSVLDKSPSP